MKRFFIIAAGFVAFFLILAQVFPASGQDYGTTRRTRDRYMPPRGGTYDGSIPPDGRAEEMPPGLNRPERIDPRDARAQDVNSPLRKWDFLADSNAIRMRLQKFEGVEKTVDDVTAGGLREMRSWDISRPGDNKDAAVGVQEQAMEELAAIRQLAKEEGAKKTLAAIDAIMLERHQRYDKMLTKMELERRRIMRNDRTGLRGTTRPRPGTRRYGESYRVDPRSRYGQQYEDPYGRRDTGANPQDEYPPEEPYRRGR